MSPPVFFGELVDSKKVGRRTFLYYFGMSSGWNYRETDLDGIVAGIACPTRGICLRSEVLGLSEQGQAWLRAFGTERESLMRILVALTTP